MTRINLVPPEELRDQHLFAEFREIKMVPKSLRRSIRAHGIEGVLKRVPAEFLLGKGHVSFFYDKGLYLMQRYSLLRHELRRRGVNFNEASLLDPDRTYELDQRLRGDYVPTPEALALIRERIASRVAMKPFWYRKTIAEEAEAVLRQTPSGCDICPCCGE